MGPLHRIKSRELWLRFTQRSPSARKISKFVSFSYSIKMSIGRSLNGKNEQTDQNKKTKNPSKARQLKQTNKQSNKQKQSVLRTTTSITTITTTTTDLPRWMDSIALLFISIDKLFS